MGASSTTPRSDDKAPLHSIGYGQRPLDAVIALLRRHGIAYVADVRAQPYSRYNKDFDREALAQSLRTAGMAYVFMGDTLGARPKDESFYVGRHVDYAKLATEPSFLAGIDRLRTAHAKGLRVALMCSEEKPERCHRSRLIGQALAAEGIPLTHIDETGGLKSQAAVIALLTGTDASLFDDEPTFLSSKEWLRP